jgi:alanyl-tRNA synthetase
MQADEIRSKFLKFFEKRGHVIIPSASLVTTDTKGVTNSTLFNTAGMQPLVPYLLGEPHPKGKRLVDAQKCLRTVDIDDIGDKTHATFFEMLGNWSLGDYFKQEAINWSYEFLTSAEEGLGLDPKRLYVTVFEGDDNAPRDEEAAEIWREIFAKNNIDGERIFYLPADKNWWEAGENGPCGPDTEMYYDIGNKFGGQGLTREQFIQADADDVRDVVEIWNDVFMQYEKKDGKIIGKLPKPSVDTGAGLERVAMTLQGVDNIYETDLLHPVMRKIEDLTEVSDLKSRRIVADHLRTAVFMIADGVVPSNTDRGYILRRLLRRAVRRADILEMDANQLAEIAEVVIEKYKTIYPEVELRKEIIKSEISKEEAKFRETLERGMREFEKKITVSINKAPILTQLPGDVVFDLYQSHGFPFELTKEIAKEKGIEIDEEGFKLEMERHQDLSRAGAEQKFKGGLASGGEMETKYHTTTHLLHQALREVLGGHVEQKGSNITAERLRFDFAHTAKMTDEEKKKVEKIVNEKILEALPVQQVILSRAEAEKTGALHFFADKYGDEVSVYFVGSSLEEAYSKEFCGGPHVKNTSELGHFKITKEEAVAAGIRRIKAVLQ